MAVVAVLAAVVVLAGCVPEPDAIPVSTPEGASTASPVPVATIDPDPVVPQPEPTPGLCDAGSLLAIWAHYDDDLIFGHSRVSEALANGWCVTIAYLSAGDAGKGVEYSRGREQGIRDAYDTLRGAPAEWTMTVDTLDTGVTVEEWSPADDERLELLSFRLVDGNIDGSGFASMGYESLAKLASGAIDTIRDVDGPEHLTRDDITQSLVEIVTDADPDAVLTGMPREAVDLARGDHSDHSSTASFARAAWRSMGYDAAQVTYAIGYQTSDYDKNVTGDELARKVAIFSSYAIQDPVTAACRDLDSCLNLRLFGAWLQREYSRGAAELDLG